MKNQINLKIANQCQFCNHFIIEYGSSGKKKQGKCELTNKLVHVNLICDEFELFKTPYITLLTNKYYLDNK